MTGERPWRRSQVTVYKLSFSSLSPSHLGYYVSAFRLEHCLSCAVRVYSSRQLESYYLTPKAEKKRARCTFFDLGWPNPLFSTSALHSLARFRLDSQSVHLSCPILCICHILPHLSLHHTTTLDLLSPYSIHLSTFPISFDLFLEAVTRCLLGYATG